MKPVAPVSAIRGFRAALRYFTAVSLMLLLPARCPNRLHSQHEFTTTFGLEQALFSGAAGPSRHCGKVDPSAAFTTGGGFHLPVSASDFGA